MITKEREAELDELFGSESNDPETQEWRDGLTEDEQQLIDNWDDQYEKGILNIASRILGLGGNNDGEEA
jgi:hypothetical protein